MVFSHGFRPSLELHLVPRESEFNASVGQELLELALFGLQVAVASDVLLADEDVGDGGLAGQLGEGGLDTASICGGVELDGVVLDIEFVEELL